MIELTGVSSSLLLPARNTIIFPHDSPFGDYCQDITNKKKMRCVHKKNNDQKIK